MSNMPKLGGPVIPRGDMGIGFCYRCVQYMLQQQIRGGDLAGFVILALPACYACLAGEGLAGKPGSGLVVPRGG